MLRSDWLSPVRQAWDTFMKDDLRALIVEDSEDDALLLLDQLAKASYDVHWRRVETAESLVEALDAQEWDIVFADYSMPHFSGAKALAVVRERSSDVPFIFVSGTIGEDTAVEAMRCGANDYIMKGNYKRLAPAVARELRDAEARRSRSAMERELVRRNEEAAQARAESGFKSKFLANLSHELRTPLNVIMGFSELLKDQSPGSLTATQEEYLDELLQGARHLHKLVDDIRDLSKIEADRIELQFERICVANIVDSIRSAMRALADRRGLRLDVDVPPGLPDILADPVRIRQILYNLLSNAIKFTPAGGRVRMAVHADPQNLHIAVSDTGVGIAARDIPRLFQEFQRVERPAGERYEGTGLGLALCRRLVALHGGSVSVDSKLGEGSTFTLVLPIQPPALTVGSCHAGPAQRS